MFGSISSASLPFLRNECYPDTHRTPRPVVGDGLRVVEQEGTGDEAQPDASSSLPPSSLASATLPLKSFDVGGIKKMCTRKEPVNKLDVVHVPEEHTMSKLETVQKAC